jgi:membrane peptidoglycan carboxypeptidase
MTFNSNEKYNGFALYSKDKRPIGVISDSGERYANCNDRYIPNKLKQYLVEIEDHRFYAHGAIDIRGISRAAYENIKARRITQGGSTITQQLARNILKENRKSIFRKIRETSLAFELEKQYSKDEIVDLYFNKVFWGKRNYGIRSASFEYFSKEPKDLSTKEQLALLTLLRGPNYYLNNKLLLENRCDLLSKILYEKNILSTKKYSSLMQSKVVFNKCNLSVFRANSVPFISTDIDIHRQSIISSLDNALQREVDKFIDNCKYPTSVIGSSGDRVICVGSSFGTDYPFVFRSNVGSTLKPFVYTHLRRCGVEHNDYFSTTSSYSKNWEIREVQNPYNDSLTLSEALRLSNNNAFVNAAFENGIDNTLRYLAEVTSKPLGSFVPSSILGATTGGLTLYDLVQAYNNFFKDINNDPIKRECRAILNNVAIEKFAGEFSKTFIKTGTTNSNKERFAIVGYANSLFGFLRQGNEVDDHSKEGGFISNILEFLRIISNKVYEWK